MCMYSYVITKLVVWEVLLLCRIFFNNFLSLENQLRKHHPSFLKYKKMTIKNAIEQLGLTLNQSFCIMECFPCKISVCILYGKNNNNNKTPQLSDIIFQLQPSLAKEYIYSKCNVSMLCCNVSRLVF